MSKRVLILGIGNPLMTDEGVGVRVAEILMNAYQFPEGVEVVDAGTLGLGIINLLRDRDLVIVVDAVDKTGHEPGTVVILTPDEMAPAQVLHTLHDVRFTNVLEAATLTGIQPDAICVGVQVASMEQWVTELTSEVETALPVAIAAVLDILESHGITPVESESTSEVARIIENIRTRVHEPGV
ncbi:MAG: HyaD/HybD family hydrogenase maturation endopeptidase [Coriobacteriia bacterium]|jgi:hydrogenase maturation protease|nr:HyaD/HybD family hydrogenase maturation endopeptidase [Coriobacteriia bacterium]